MNKVRGLLTKFKILREYLDISHLKIVYYALVQSLLAYGILGWGGVTDNHLDKVHVVQKWILKIIFNKNMRYPSDALYEISQIYDTRQLFAYKILMNIHKGKIPLEPINHIYGTRNKDFKAAVNKCDKSIGQHSCQYISAKLYNYLPKDLKNSVNFHQYKKSIKKWLLSESRKVFHNMINTYLKF